MFDLTGKVALITGSTKGIGKSIAGAMAMAGAKVVISSRKAEACEEVTREFTSKGFDAIS
jgi:NAD(P)-dependent dehydrogenase (short-subunit alcohol dehydrogenase family)